MSLNATLASCLLAFVLVSGTMPARAQEPRNAPGVFAVPRSNEVVEIEVHFDNGEIIPVSVREGAMFTVRTGEGYHALTPVIDAEQQEIEFELWRVHIVPGPTGGEGADYAGLVFADIGEFAWSDIDELDFDLKVLGVRTGDGFKMPPRSDPSLTRNEEELRRMAARGTCCIESCAGNEVCGCSASSACGSCCTDGCCLDGQPRIFNQGLRTQISDP